MSQVLLLQIPCCYIYAMPGTVVFIIFCKGCYGIAFLRAKKETEQPEWALFLELVCVPESYEEDPSNRVSVSAPCNQSEGCVHQVHLCMSENISCQNVRTQPHHTVG